MNGAKNWLRKGYMLALRDIQTYADRIGSLTHGDFIVAWSGSPLSSESPDYNRGKADAYLDILEYTTALQIKQREHDWAALPARAKEEF